MKAQGYTKETILDLGLNTKKFPEFREGDTIAVHQRITEGEKERVQVFQGDVIALHKKGGSTTFTVRKIGAHGIPVERIIPLNSPLIKDIELIKTGDVRRAKLYYVRDRLGKSTRLKEKLLTHDQKEQRAHDLAETQIPVPSTKVPQPPVKAA